MTKKKVSFSDMVTRATERAEIERLRQLGNVMKLAFETVTGESIDTGVPIKSDQDRIYDIMDRQESEASL